jgi:hypothetical protein
MAMKYQKGTVYPRGQKVKMWYGKYTVYLRMTKRKGGRKAAQHSALPQSWNAKVEGRADVARHHSQRDRSPCQRLATSIADDSATFRWFVGERYIPMRQGAWSPAYRKINTYEIKHYLVEHFGRIPLGQLGTFEIQVWLNKLAGQYSQSVFATAMQHSLDHSHGQEVEFPGQ